MKNLWRALILLTLIATQASAARLTIPGGGAGGGGTVTSVDCNGGIETAGGVAITTSGSCRGSELVNAQTLTSYTYVTGDRGKLVTHTNAGAIAGTLPQAGASFPSGWYMDVQNRGAGTLTITPTTSTVDDAATLVLTTNQGVRIVSDGTNYFTQRGIGGGGNLTATYITKTVDGTLTNSQALSSLSSGCLSSTTGTGVVASTGGPCGTVTSVDASGGVEITAGSPITTTGVVRGSHLVNAQSGTTYTVVTGDRGKLVSHNNAASIAVTLPQAGGSFPAGWHYFTQSIGAGAVTITPTTSTIDGASSATLTQNQGAMIISDGTNYFTMRGASGPDTDTLQSVFSRGKTITTANSLANAMQVGDGVNPMCIYTDATYGATAIPCTAADVRQLILTNFSGGLYDQANACWIEKVTPSAGTPQGVWTYSCSGSKPKKSAWIGPGAWFGDGTNCPTDPSTVTINSGAKMSTFVCTNNNASILNANFEMPDEWDGGTITLMASIVQTAVDTNAWKGFVSASCRANGDTINSTWGTEVQLLISNVGGSNKINTVTSGAVTPNGTCTGAGTMLQLKFHIDSAGTTTAIGTLNHLGFKLVYSVKSRSS